jgi:hypothetical protein
LRRSARFIRQERYKWREPSLTNANKVFDTKAQSKKEARLEREAQKLKGMIGELHVELKKAIGKAASHPPVRDCFSRCGSPANDS